MSITLMEVETIQQLTSSGPKWLHLVI